MEKMRAPRIPLTNSLQVSAQVSRADRIFSCEGPRDAPDIDTHPRPVRVCRADSCGRAGDDAVARGAAMRRVEGRFAFGDTDRVAPAGRGRRMDVLDEGSQRVYEEEPLRSVRFADDEDARGRETSGSGGRRRRDPAGPAPLGPRHGGLTRSDARGAADPVVGGAPTTRSPHSGGWGERLQGEGSSALPFSFRAVRAPLSGRRGGRAGART
jgi:hypothetical protein